MEKEESTTPKLSNPLFQALYANDTAAINISIIFGQQYRNFKSLGFTETEAVSMTTNVLMFVWALSNHANKN